MSKRNSAMFAIIGESEAQTYKKDDSFSALSPPRILNKQ
jgi:hypothetical protein